MPWSGAAPSQQFTRTDGTSSGDDTWTQAAAAPRNIEADDHDVHDTDIKDGINACLKKDGGNTATSDIPMGGFTITNISAAGARTEPASYGDVQDNKGQYVASVGGTADVITLSPTIAITAYAAGQRFTFIAGASNTGATTVNVSGVGAKSIVRQDGANTALSAGDITSGTIVDIEYDGTRFLLLSLAKLPAAIAASAGITSRSTSTTEYVGERYAADTNGATVSLNKSRHATISSHTVVQSGDVLGELQFNGSDGTNFENAALIRGISDGTPGSDDMPGGLVFYTTADGSNSGTERIAIRANGKVQIPNRSAPLLQFDSTGFVDISEISAPSNPSADIARLYGVDSGGTTILAYRDSAGTVTNLRPAVIDRAYAEYTTNAALSTTIPLDDSIPQQTGEGTEIVTASITPKKLANRVRVTFTGQVTGSGNVDGQRAIAALFQDATEDALRAVATHVNSNEGSAVDEPAVLSLAFEHSPNTTSAVTYKIKVGANSGTVRMNGTASARWFGGVSAATLILEEIQM